MTTPLGVSSGLQNISGWFQRGPRLEEPFPVVAGNSICVVGREGCYFEGMLEAVEQATVSVDVEMYMWDDDELGRRFIDALARAARRDVAVRVLVDAFGSREVVGRPLDALREAGGRVRVFNPFRLPVFKRFIHRTHKKLLVLDGHLAFCGGAGFSSFFSTGKRRERPWHDRTYEIRGPMVWQLLTVFEVDFARWPTPPGRRGLTTSPGHFEQQRAGTARGRVLRGWPDARGFQRTFVAALDAAHKRVWIGTPYFLPPRRLRRAIYGARERGVDVCLLLPALEGANAFIWYASRRYFGRLLRRGVRIFEFGPAFFHAKLAIKDDDTAIIGSSNMDPWSWRRNAELDLLFVDPGTVSMIAACFEEDLARSQEVTRDAHESRHRLQRAIESVAGLFDRWL